MQQFLALWLALTPRKRLIAAAATLGMVATVYVIAGIATRPSMALLYAGLEGSNAGEVLAALDQRAIGYEVRGAAIYVDATRRDELRMDLASQGLPANSGAGYELLDGLSGFGTTSQMFDAAYWRAKEGELARTIAAMPNMKSVRVHLANAEPQGFRAKAAPTASVAVVTRDGVTSQAQARALRFLVASAVAGMRPDDVSIIDGQGNLLQTDDSNAPGAGDDRAAGLRENVMRLLEARVGPGKAVVEVALETVTDSETLSERKIDPEGRVVISSATEEQTSSANDQGSSGVSVASNLPSGAASGSGKTSQKQDSQTREQVNYEVSETKRDLVRGPGATRRLTVAVLVDGIMAAPAEGGENQWQARPDEELAALRDLVAAAVGFDEARGDVITIKTLAFEPFVPLGAEAEASIFPAFAIDVMSLVQLGVLAIVALVLGLFVVRPVLTARPSQTPAALPAPPAAALGPALSGVIEEGEFVPRDLPMVAGGARGPGETGGHDELADPVARLRRLVSERQEESVQILKNWMDDPKAERA